MGAAISLTQNETAPVTLHATSLLNGINYSLPIASAQLKSALLLAGLAADGTTDLTGKLASRDHTERLLKYFGCQLSSDFEGSILTRLSIPGGQSLRGSELSVPGDISSAAFWLVLATLLPHCRIEIDSVLLNPTRTGLVEVLKKMGAPIKTEVTSWEPEPVGWIHASHSELKGIEITAEDIPSLIDELPLIAVLATFAHGTTLVRGAEELRVKETDRLAAIAQNLRAMGAQMELFADGFAIHGPQPLHGATLYSFGDHRIAMAFSIAAVNAQGPSQIIGSECVSISYPDFYETLNSAF
jgi:3-phosphoshikimate 1-carboxyvinyltransferase